MARNSRPDLEWSGGRVLTGHEPWPILRQVLAYPHNPPNATRASVGPNDLALPDDAGDPYSHGAASLVSAVLLAAARPPSSGLAAVRADGLPRSVCRRRRRNHRAGGHFPARPLRPAAGGRQPVPARSSTASPPGSCGSSPPTFGVPQTHLNLAASLLVPAGLFVRRELAATGGNARRVKFLVRQLLSRKEWPVHVRRLPGLPADPGLARGPPGQRRPGPAAVGPRRRAASRWRC